MLGFKGTWDTPKRSFDVRTSPEVGRDADFLKDVPACSKASPTTASPLAVSAASFSGAAAASGPVVSSLIAAAAGAAVSVPAVGLMSAASSSAGAFSSTLVARAIRNAIRANHSQLKPLLFIVRQADSHESLEFPIRANHPIRANRANRFARITPLRVPLLVCLRLRL